MLDMAEIKAALAAATPGPWDGVLVIGDHPDACLNNVGICHSESDNQISHADTSLIASAPTWITALVARVEELEHQLGNLLAVIHRDGGHYQIEHGTEKAVADAMQVSSERTARVEELATWQREALPAVKSDRENRRYGVGLDTAEGKHLDNLIAKAQGQVE